MPGSSAFAGLARTRSVRAPARQSTPCLPRPSPSPPCGMPRRALAASLALAARHAHASSRSTRVVWAVPAKKRQPGLPCLRHRPGWRPRLALHVGACPAFRTALTSGRKGPPRAAALLFRPGFAGLRPCPRCSPVRCRGPAPPLHARPRARSAVRCAPSQTPPHSRPSPSPTRQHRSSVPGVGRSVGRSCQGAASRPLPIAQMARPARCKRR